MHDSVASAVLIRSVSSLKVNDKFPVQADLEIAQRLENLRKSQTKELPTEEEMASRLAHLKGLPPDHYIKPAIQHQQPDTRTEGQKADDLISQVHSKDALCCGRKCLNTKSKCTVYHPLLQVLGCAKQIE